MNVHAIAEIAKGYCLKNSGKLRDEIVSECESILESFDTIEKGIIPRDISLLPVYNTNESYAIDLDSIKYTMRFKNLPLEEAVDLIKKTHKINEDADICCIIPDNMTFYSEADFEAVKNTLLETGIIPYGNNMVINENSVAEKIFNALLSNKTGIVEVRSKFNKFNVRWLPINRSNFIHGYDNQILIGYFEDGEVTEEQEKEIKKICNDINSTTAHKYIKIMYSTKRKCFKLYMINEKILAKIPEKNEYKFAQSIAKSFILQSKDFEGLDKIFKLYPKYEINEEYIPFIPILSFDFSKAKAMLAGDSGNTVADVVFKRVSNILIQTNFAAGLLQAGLIVKSEVNGFRGLIHMSKK